MNNARPVLTARRSFRLIYAGFLFAGVSAIVGVIVALNLSYVHDFQCAFSRFEGRAPPRLEEELGPCDRYLSPTLGWSSSSWEGTPAIVQRSAAPQQELCAYSYERQRLRFFGCADVRTFIVVFDRLVIGQAENVTVETAFAMAEQIQFTLLPDRRVRAAIPLVRGRNVRYVDLVAVSDGLRVARICFVDDASAQVVERMCGRVEHG